MTDPRVRVAKVVLSDSFGTAFDDVAREVAVELVAWEPEGGTVLPDGVRAVLILAGGEEPAVIDLLGRLPASGVPVYVVGSRGDHRLTAELLQTGATDYFALPADLDLTRRTMERLVNAARAHEAAGTFAEAEHREVGFTKIVGQSDAIRGVVDRARRVAQHPDVTLLIEGETGTGKEVLARAIHYGSPRARQPFVEINCAAIPESLLESELFGHERGAFTGAVAAKQGLFEMAHGGTLFLDEIGHLPLELQAKLLRALESRTIRRVGSNKTFAIDVRVIAATHVRLGEAVARGEFREDLFYRLNVVALRLPALRERDGDIELLAEFFTRELAAHHRLATPSLSEEVRATLRAHRWPGNVRELRNTIERALVLSAVGELQADELGLDSGEVPARVADSSALPFPAPLENIIRAAVAAMVELTNGNKSEAARILGISRPRLQRWLNEPDDGPSCRDHTT